MAKHLLSGFVLVLGLALTGLAQQSSESKTPMQSFTFRPGQKVYIAAFRHGVHQQYRGATLTASIAQELDAEKRVRNEFEARQIFKVVDKLSAAEFVFLVYIDGSTAEGLALAPEDYALYKGDFDLDEMREMACVRTLVGPYRIPTLGKISNHLVKKFHEVVKVSKQAS